MSALAGRVDRGGLVNIAALGAASVLGALAALNAIFALAVVAAVLATAFILRHRRYFAPLLIVSVFFGAVSVGGAPIARLIGPIALPVAIIVGVRRGGFDLRGTSLPYWIAAYATLAFASLYWTTSAGGTVGLLFSLALAITYALAIAALTRTRKDLRLALTAFPVAAIGLFGLGAMTYVAGGAVAMQNVIGDRNFAAAFLTIALPASAIFMIAPLRGWERPLGTFATLACVIGIVSTGSQGGMLSLLGVGLLGMVFGPRPHMRRLVAPALVLLVPLVIALVVVILASGGYGKSSSGGVKSEIERASVDRLNLWRGAMNAYRHNPVTGIGYGAYAEHSAQWMLETPGVNLKLYNLPEHAQEAHNTYIDQLSELGPLGLALFVGMIGSCLLALARTLRRARLGGDAELEQLALALILAIAGFAIASFFLSVATNRGWWVIFGLTAAIVRLAYDERLASLSGSDRIDLSGREILTR